MWLKPQAIAAFFKNATIANLKMQLKFAIAAFFVNAAKKNVAITRVFCSESTINCVEWVD